MADETTWIQRYWPQILFFLTLGFAGVKNQVDTRAVKKAVFDKDGELRLVKTADCEKKQTACAKQHRVEKSNLERELQNIHDTIGKLQGTVAKMPQDVAEHLKTMGVLK